MTGMLNEKREIADCRKILLGELGGGNLYAETLLDADQQLHGGHGIKTCLMKVRGIVELGAFLENLTGEYLHQNLFLLFKGIGVHRDDNSVATVLDYNVCFNPY